MKKKSRLLLSIALPAILLSTAALVCSYLDLQAERPALAYLYYCTTVEYIFASILITLCGVVLIEIAERDRRRQ